MISFLTGFVAFLNAFFGASAIYCCWLAPISAARKDGMKSRHEFEKGWSAKKWPELQAIVGEKLEEP